jgi:hypothetical protein
MLGFFKRLLIAFTSSYLFCASIIIFQWSSYESEWHEAVRDHEIHALNKPEICERIKQGLTPLPDMNCSQTQFSDLYEEVIQQHICNKVKHGQVSLLLTEYSCDRSSPPIDPLSTYAWDNHIKELFRISFVSSIVIFFVITLIKQYIDEVSQGWKRLSLVLSAPITILISLNYFDESFNKTIFASFILLPIILLVLLNCKIVYEWVKTGFYLDK